jgi:hypothetical protein
MMNKTRCASLFATLLVFLMTPMVNAEGVTLTDRQIQVIKTNCVNAQSSIRQLQLAESATRINRGHSYESVSKLMAALNGRLALNKLSIPTLTSGAGEMDKRFTVFKEDYSNYYDSLEATIRLSCAEQPVTFYDSLTNTRNLRAKVAQDIKSINDILDAYQASINDELRANLAAAGSTH